MKRALNKYLYKIELYVLRIIPILLAICSFLHTTLFHLGFDTTFLVSLGKVSFLTLGFLYISSYAFHFCSFHRAFLHYILTVNIISYVENQFRLPVSNSYKRRSIVGISKTTSKEQLINTIVHEAKHIQSHICRYYNVNEGSETAAYLIGYITQQMYKVFKYLL